MVSIVGEAPGSKFVPNQTTDLSDLALVAVKEVI
jgi:hypothetical protein